MTEHLSLRVYIWDQQPLLRWTWSAVDFTSFSCGRHTSRLSRSRGTQGLGLRQGPVSPWQADPVSHPPKLFFFPSNLPIIARVHGRGCSLQHVFRSSAHCWCDGRQGDVALLIGREPTITCKWRQRCNEWKWNQNQPCCPHPLISNGTHTRSYPTAMAMTVLPCRHQ